MRVKNRNRTRIGLVALGLTCATIAPAANADWLLVDNFEDATLNSDLAGRTRNGNSGSTSIDATWVVGSNTGITSDAKVVSDPTSSLNNVGRIQSRLTSAHVAMGSIGASSSATVYMRFRVSIDSLGTLHSAGVNESAGFFGVTDDASPANIPFTSFEAQFGVNPAFGTGPSSSTLPFHLVSTNAIDPDGPGPIIGTINRFPANQQIHSDTWYHSWTVLNNATTSYRLYLMGGQFAVPTLVTTTLGGDFSNPSPFTDLTFRNGTALNTATDALRTVIRTGTDHLAPMFFDDIYFNDSAADTSFFVPEPSVAIVGVLGFASLLRRRRQI